MQSPQPSWNSTTLWNTKHVRHITSCGFPAGRRINPKRTRIRAGSASGSDWKVSKYEGRAPPDPRHPPRPDPPRSRLVCPSSDPSSVIDLALRLGRPPRPRPRPAASASPSSPCPASAAAPSAPAAAAAFAFADAFRFFLAGSSPAAAGAWCNFELRSNYCQFLITIPLLPIFNYDPIIANFQLRSYSNIGQF